MCAGQLALFPVRTSRRVVSYARPDGGPLTDADFDHLARLARTASGASPTHERPTPVMPLSVPLVLDPGRFYTVHLHRVCWDAARLGGLPLAALEETAREGLRWVSECIPAELVDADVAVTEYPDGSAEAVARVLCDSEVCAAVAENFRRDPSDEAEAEAARVWAAGQLPGQEVQLFRRPAELAQPVPSTILAAADMLAALLTAQQQRTGGSTDTVVLFEDELAARRRRAREHRAARPDAGRGEGRGQSSAPAEPQPVPGRARPYDAGRAPAHRPGRRCRSMTTPDAVAAYLGWQQPLSHRADCARPSWEVTTRTEHDQRWGRFDEGGHACPNEDCNHHDRYDRLTVRIVCDSCGVVQLITGEEHSWAGTTTASIGYGQPPKRAGGLWLYPGPPLLERLNPESSAYLCTLEKVERPTEKDIVGAIGEEHTKRGRIVWSASALPEISPSPLASHPAPFLHWAFESGEQRFPTVVAAAKWVKAQVDAAAASGPGPTGGAG